MVSFDGMINWLDAIADGRIQELRRLKKSTARQYSGIIKRLVKHMGHDINEPASVLLDLPETELKKCIEDAFDVSEATRSSYLNAILRLRLLSREDVFAVQTPQPNYVAPSSAVIRGSGGISEATEMLDKKIEKLEAENLRLQRENSALKKALSALTSLVGSE